MTESPRLPAKGSSFAHLPAGRIDVLYGRDDELTRLRGVRGTLVVVSGDSGIGKSAVLDRLVRLTNPKEILTPEAITLLRSEGALKQGLLTALQKHVETVLDEQDEAHVVVRHLTDAAKR